MSTIQIQHPTSPVRASSAPAISKLSPTSGPARTLLANGMNGVASGRAVDLDLTAHLTARVQIVDEEKKFSTGLGNQLEKWRLLDVGFAYNIVAVFGSQSTGKSTLLNRLFGTTFDVMDETRRQQTTKGIWMCRSTPPSPLLIMDVEGTDGRERGEDQDFERKSALFSLASSEILIVNMWEHQVGLYQGANMSLLKTVFEVNLALFGKREGENSAQRTLLLFVIRDHIGATPLANLQATLTADMLRIWEGLTKPQGLQGVRMGDYFDMEFIGLPHKILVPEKFEEAIGHLRLRFTDASNPGFLFKPVYHKRIPADGVEHYMNAVWEQVQNNKDLDLPTQQELLAQFRCDEIAAVAMSTFLSGVKDVRKVVERGDVVEGLGAVMAGWRDGAITHFDHAASRYHKQVYQRKRADLLKTIHTTLHPIFYNQLKNLSKLTVIRFKKALGAGLKGEGYDFAEVVHHAREVGVESFERGAREALLSEAEEWSFDEELVQLEVEMKSVADVFRKDETTKMINGVERAFKTQLTEPVELALNKPEIDMWDRVLIGFNDLISKAEAIYTSKAAAFNCTEDETSTALGTLRKRAWLALIAKVKEHTADAALLAKLRASFEDSFRYDANGVPRVWKPEHDIDGVFKKARDTTLDLIPLYAKISPTDKGTLPDNIPPGADTAPLPGSTAEEFDFDASLILLSETKQLDITSRFRRDSDAYYVEAKRSTVSSVAQIPLWMYGVLVVLGWNEAMAVLFNPLYFTFLLISLTGAYVVFQLRLAGPIMSVGKTVVTEIQNQATLKLRAHFSQPQLAAPVASRVPQRQGSTYTTNSTLVDEAEDEVELRELSGQVR